VILDLVDEETPTHVDHLDEGEIPGGRAGRGERWIMSYKDFKNNVWSWKFGIISV